MKTNYFKLILIICVFILGGLTVAFLMQERTLYNEGYVNGNTAGNLYSGGMYCEHNGTIFFANPQDGHRLYSMNSDGSNLKKLSDDVANYINADENYVYYVRNNVGDSLDFEFFSFFRNGLCRLPRNGGKVKILDTDPSNYCTLIGNYVYYLHYDNEEASTLYKVKIDGTDKKQVRKEAIMTCCTNGQYFYYAGDKESGSIYRFDAASDTSTVIYEGNCFKPIVDASGTDIYFIDGKSTALMHFNALTEETTVVTEDEIDSFNISGDYIYYQKYDGENSGICVIRKDGTGYQMIKKGSFKEISTTEKFVFFVDFHTGEGYYFEKTTPSNVMPFKPGVKK